jgi:hypothetical protein
LIIDHCARLIVVHSAKCQYRLSVDNGDVGIHRPAPFQTEVSGSSQTPMVIAAKIGSVSDASVLALQVLAGAQLFLKHQAEYG